MITAFRWRAKRRPSAAASTATSRSRFIETSPRSWAETDLKALMTTGAGVARRGQGRQEGADRARRRGVRRRRPPATPPKPGEPDAPKPETRVAVIGDSDFAANGTLGVPGNRDLFMNTVGWLSQQDNLISIRPKEPDDRRITLTATQESNIFWLSLLIVPRLHFRRRRSASGGSGER